MFFSTDTESITRYASITMIQTGESGVNVAHGEIKIRCGLVCVTRYKRETFFKHEAKEYNDQNI